MRIDHQSTQYTAMPRNTEGLGNECSVYMYIMPQLDDHFGYRRSDKTTNVSIIQQVILTGVINRCQYAAA